jgi:hypothetical protein
MLGVICALLLAGIYWEGLRIHQGSFLLGFIIHSSLAYVLSSEVGIRVVTIVGTVLVLISILLMISFGDSDLSRLKMTGPFEVGHREFRTGKLGSEVSVYYPIEIEHYNQMMKQSKNNSAWLRHGDKTLEGLV